MSNKITEKYFDSSNFAQEEKRIIKEIIQETGFKIEKELFRGKIYKNEKLGSLIFQGSWQNAPAILKIQGLKPEIEEAEIIKRFNKQNQSSRIRLPKIYKHSPWKKDKGYGWLILEQVNGSRIYQASLAGDKEIKDFCAFYKEYKTKAINEPLFKPEETEKSSLVFTSQRISHWLNIAHSQNTLTYQKIKLAEEFLFWAGKHLPKIKMEFTHGHLSSSDIFKTPKGEYILMSNLFWSYRPEFYDTTFHLWAGLKSLDNTKTKSKEIKKYLDKWLQEYKKIPFIKKDKAFEKKFNLMLAERCLGALLVDINNQTYARDKKKRLTYLEKLFTDLFKYFVKNLDK